MSYLKKDGFSCEPLRTRLEKGGQASLHCSKQIAEKKWWGLTEYHYINAVIDADDSNKITSVDVRISWGGLRGL